MDESIKQELALFQLNIANEQLKINSELQKDLLDAREFFAVETDKLWKAITEIQARLDVIDYKQRIASDFIDNLPNFIKPQKKGRIENLMNKIYK